MLASKERHYYSLEEYFDYIADTLGYPKYYKDFTDDYVVSDGIRLHLDVLEYSKDAPTVVFVPGTAIYTMCYADFLYKLGSQGFNIVGVDPRGHGRSDGERGDYTVTELMRDVQNAIGYAIHRYGENVSLLGSSQGGIVALYLAAKDTRLKGVTCQCFADLTSPETSQLTRFPRLSRYMKPLMMQFGGITPNTPIPINIYLDLDSVTVKYFGNAKKFMNVDPLALHNISFRALQSLASTRMHKPLEEIDTPVMVFQGDEDSIFSVDYTQNIYDQLTCKKRFDVFPGLNHAIMTEDPEAVIPAVVEWLNEIHD